ncbi:unnamed protein product [Lampetra fluviatilis]
MQQSAGAVHGSQFASPRRREERQAPAGGPRGQGALRSLRSFRGDKKDAGDERCVKQIMAKARERPLK